MASQLFSNKSHDQLLKESENPERQMKLTLPTFDLTAMGIGAIVGAGIFLLGGTASAGETFFQQDQNAADEIHYCRSIGSELTTRKAGR